MQLLNTMKKNKQRKEQELYPQLKLAGISIQAENVITSKHTNRFMQAYKKGRKIQ